MKLSEIVRVAWDAIIKNKVRSLLTMLGIIIGVAAVIMVVAISAGTEATISDQITSLGSNLIFVTANFGRGGPESFRNSGGAWSSAMPMPSPQQVRCNRRGRRTGCQRNRQERQGNPDRCQCPGHHRGLPRRSRT